MCRCTSPGAAKIHQWHPYSHTQRSLAIPELGQNFPCSIGAACQQSELYGHHRDGDSSSVLSFVVSQVGLPSALPGYGVRSVCGQRYRLPQELQQFYIASRSKTDTRMNASQRQRKRTEMGLGMADVDRRWRSRSWAAYVCRMTFKLALL